jgi:hypothetical protein
LNQVELQALWEDRIARALKKREEDWEKPFRVEIATQYMEGRQRPPEVNAAEWITVNKIYSHMQAQLPLLYSLDPYYFVKLKKSYEPNPMLIALYEAKAEVRQNHLNYLKKELCLKETARLAIQDAHPAFGVIKTHYVADEIENETAGKPILGEDGEPLLDDNGEELLEPEVIPMNERYAIDRVHWKDLLFSEDAGTLEPKWHWIAERFRITPEEAKKRKLISRSAFNEATLQTRDEKSEAKGIFGGIFKKTAPNNSKQIRDVYVGWEIYDLDNKEWLIILEGSKTPAKMPAPLPAGVECHPYSILRFTYRDESPYPVPPLSQAIDPQKEYNMARSRLLVHRKRFNRKYEVFVQALEDETELDKLESGEDGVIIRKQTPGDAVKPIQDAPLDQQSYIEINHLNNDMTEMMGSPGNARGIADTDSATEAALLDKRLDIREGDRISQVSDWLSDIGRKLDQLVQAHITQDEVIKVSGPNLEQAWRLVRTTDYSDIYGEYEYSVDVGSTRPRLPQLERSSLLAFIQVLAGFPHIMTSARMMKKLAEMHDITDDTLVEELRQIGLNILQGKTPMPGQSGSKAGVSEQNPITSMMGAVMGNMGGVTNGGGTPAISQS